jgi:hypothetical protein
MSSLRLIWLIFILAVMVSVGWLMTPYYEALVRYIQHGKGPCDYPVMRACWHKQEKPLPKGSQGQKRYHL